MKKWIVAFFVFFNVLPVGGQDLTYSQRPKHINLSLNKQYVITQIIRGTEYAGSGNINLFFDVELLTPKDTFKINACVKKVILQSTIANQTRVFDSEKLADSASEMSVFFKRILRSPILMDVSASKGEIIGLDTSKAVEFLATVQWENFFDDFSSSIFNYISVAEVGRDTLSSKKSEGFSEEINYLLDSTSGGNRFFSITGNRKTNDERQIAGSKVFQEYDFTLTGVIKVDIASHFVLSKKTIYSGKGSMVIGDKKNSVTLNQVIESVISFPVD